MLESKDHGQRQAGDESPRDGEGGPPDSITTRRALLTGGAVVAGAAVATVAATDEAAAVDFVVLGANNNETAATVFRSTASRAVGGICTARDSAGISGRSDGARGTGLFGVAHVDANSQGVWGVSDNGIGVLGQSDSSIGVQGTGANFGVRGKSTSNYGVAGDAGYAGVLGTGGSYGVYGTGTSAGVVATTTAGYGGYFQGPVGCLGIGSGTGYGCWGYNSASGGYGVVGQGGYRGVYASGGNAGVYGTSGYVGLWGNATGSSGLNYGIYAVTTSSGGYAGVFSGPVQVSGFLSKLGGGFLIDHPLDPEHKWLRHSFVESPDMMNVYNGNVTTNSSGLAVVKLPAYFTALNRDFRYQLTVIGTFAQAIIDRKIANNQFRIRTNKGNVEVSWQVTGIRQDDYAKEHRMVVEEAKKAHEAGGRQFVAKGSSARLKRIGPVSDSDLAATSMMSAPAPIIQPPSLP